MRIQRPSKEPGSITFPHSPISANVPSTSTIGSRRRAAAIASPSRVVRFLPHAKCVQLGLKGGPINHPRGCKFNFHGVSPRPELFKDWVGDGCAFQRRRPVTAGQMRLAGGRPASAKAASGTRSSIDTWRPSRSAAPRSRRSRRNAPHLDPGHALAPTSLLRNAASPASETSTHFGSGEASRT